MIFYSAVALINTANDSVQKQVIETQVRYRHLSDVQIVAYLERELGQLRTIAKAIAYENITLTEWVCRQGEGRIKCEVIDGVKVCKPDADSRFYEYALLELRFAARRLMSAIEA